MSNKIHHLADVQSLNIGEDTVVWQFAIILKGATIGSRCNINCHTFIENDVVIGDNVTIKSGVYLWDGIRIENDVFVGPNATFTNDKYPRSKQYPELFQQTTLSQGCSIGAGATVLGGVQIGAYAIVGAGSLVTKDVPEYALVVGSPARVVAWIDRSGEKLVEIEDGMLVSKNGERFQILNNKIEKI